MAARVSEGLLAKDRQDLNPAVETFVAPFFIIGASRSGTTMLRIMLASHSMLEVPPEAWFLGKIVCSTDGCAPLNSADLERIKNLVVHDGTWPEWNVEESKLAEVFRGMEDKKLAELLDALFRIWGKAGSRSVRWGEKSPRHTYIAGQLKSLFAGAQFIHMLRDGRDSCASMLQRGWYEGSFRRICQHWSSCTKAAVEFGQSHPSGMLEVRFERLLADPEGEMQSVCRFLGVPFEPSIVDYQAYAREHLPPSARDVHSKLFRPPDAQEAGKWKRSMNVWQEAIFLAVAGRTARQVGYGSGHRLAARILSPFAALIAMCASAIGLLKAIHPRRAEPVPSVR